MILERGSSTLATAEKMILVVVALIASVREAKSYGRSMIVKAMSRASTKGLSPKDLAPFALRRFVDNTLKFRQST